MTDELSEACEYLFGEEVVSEGDHDDSLMALESFIIGAAATFEKKLTNLNKQNTFFKTACEEARGEAAQAQAILDEQLKQRASKKRKIGVVTINDDDDTDVEDDVPIGLRLGPDKKQPVAPVIPKKKPGVKQEARGKKRGS